MMERRKPAEAVSFTGLSDSPIAMSYKKNIGRVDKIISPKYGVNTQNLISWVSSSIVFTFNFNYVSELMK
jgi:hypothetical protein